MPPSPKTITAAAMTTNRITSLRELLDYQGRYRKRGIKACYNNLDLPEVKLLSFMVE